MSRFGGALPSGTKPTRRGSKSATALALAAATTVIAALMLAPALVASHPRASGGAADRTIGPTDRRTTIDFAFELRVPHAAAMRRYLARLNDPASPAYRRFVGPDVLGARFGLSLSSIREVVTKLDAAGLHVTDSYRQRTALGVRGTVADAERFFGVGFVDRVDAWGHRYHAPDGTPRIPRAFAGTLASAVGLDDAPVFVPRDIVDHPDFPGVHPADLAAAYDITPLWNMGIQGQGQSVAVVSPAGHLASDIVAYDRTFAVPAPAVVQKVVAANHENSLEVDLDLETIQAVAPKATLYNYEGLNTWNDTYRIYNRIVSDHLVNVVSVSWGACETRAPSSAFSKLLGMAAGDGITIFVASADQGAYDCMEKGTKVEPCPAPNQHQDCDPADHSLSVDFPGSNPNVVSVGGTRLSVRSDGTYYAETSWGNDISRWSGGGGVSRIYARPAWQQGPGVDVARISNGFRQEPDVSGDAASSSGISVIGHDGTTEYRMPVGGTSAAAPFWAGDAVLMDQYVATQHLAPPPYLNPILYELAATTQPFPPFHDVTVGRNLHYHAGPGWDFATGLGSPDAYDLARDLAAYLAAH